MFHLRTSHALSCNSIGAWRNGGFAERPGEIVPRGVV
jgi:hypothetical protein